ncbi:MAG: hypothetical protein WBF71_04480, partial [Microthrixaceae bacterium]
MTSDSGQSMGDKTPQKPRRESPIGERPKPSSTGSERRGTSRAPAKGHQPQGPRPEHPSGAATLLIIGVTLLIFLIAAVSTFSGR